MLVPDHFPDKSVCIVGLGYVGVTLAAVMADVGFEVHGVEIRDDVLDSLKDGKAHLFEPGLDDIIQRSLVRGNISFAKHVTPEPKARVYIITVGTPLDATGVSRLDMIENVSREIAAVLRDGDLVIMRSTVKIGTTRNVVVPILRQSGVKFHLAFCPERTIEGAAVRELRFLPQIVGATDDAANVRASQLFQFLTPTVVRVASVEAAEMIKLIDNAQRDVSFAFSNEVARMCDGIGISARDVIEAGKLGYPRTNLPMPGPVGGPCLEKDTYILAESVAAAGVVPEIALAARRLNENQPTEVVAQLREMTAGLVGFPATPIITLAGIAFKGRPATGDLRGTMARPILQQLKAAFPGAELRGFDPVVAAAEVAAFGLSPCPTLESAFDGASLVVIANNHPELTEMPVERLAGRMARPGLVYDFWNSFSARDLNMPDGTGYVALGARGVATMP